MIYARRYHWQEVNPAENTALLEAFVQHPEFLSYPLPPDQARAVGAHLLTNVENLVWVTYSDATLTGCVILTRIVPRVDALLHFLFLDKDLKSKRNLLGNVLTHCFRDLGFNRLSMEVPDRVLAGERNLAIGTKLERFARKALGFRLEGEIRKRPPGLPNSLTDDWVARQGSRREQAYFDGAKWHDIVLLRLLAGEWEGRCRLDQPQPPLPHPSSEPPPAASSEAAAPVTPSPSSPETSSP